MSQNHVATRIQLTDGRAAWGLVTVINPDLTIDRQFRISAEDFERLQQEHTAPVGVSAEEWEKGFVQVHGRPCLAGQAMPQPDGALIVNYGISEEAGLIKVLLMLLTPDEWHVEAGVVYVERLVASQIDVN